LRGPSSTWRGRLLGWGSATLLTLLSRIALAEDAAPEAPSVAALGKPVSALLWGVAQTIPSPVLSTDGEVVQGGLRWQLTPLLYSFGVAARPWRYFYVSPIARLSGSVELFVAPEWTCCAGGDSDGWLGRAGLRTYLPLLEHGEALAWSLGASCWQGVERGVSADLGLYTLFGLVGLVVTVSPGLRGRTFTTALSIRYF
jgi:hypothetical protein